MGKKILVGITILLIAGLFTGWYLFTREAKYLGTSAFRAIPRNSAVVIRIHNLKKFTSGSLNNPIWKTCSTFPGISDLYQKFGLADSLLSMANNTGNSFAEKDLTIAFGEEVGRFQWLSLVELASLTEKRELVGLISRFFQRKGATIQKIKSEKGDLSAYRWKGPDGETNYYVTFFRGLFLGSNDRKMLMLAVGQLENPGFHQDAVFERAIKSTAFNIDAQIYLNHQKLPQFSRQLFTSSFGERLKGSSPLASWSEIDLTQKSDELILNGFSCTSDSLNNHLGIFLHQQPDSLTLTRIFPAETSCFLSYVINDNTRFFEDYEHSLAANFSLDAYRKSLNEIDSAYGINLQKIVKEHLDGAAAMVFTRPDPQIPEENKYLVLKINSQSQVEEALSPIAIRVPGLKKRDKPKNYTLLRIDEETSFKIYQTDIKDFGKRIFGEVFADAATNYYTFYENCMIMGGTFESVERFLRSDVLQETLANDPVYRKFTPGLSDRLNIYLWCSPGRALPFFREMINGKLFAETEKKHAELLKIESLGWQIGNENGMIYNMARLKFNADVRESPVSVLWKSHLEAAAITRPQFVTNPADKSHPEILVQDGKFNLVLITPEGRIKWKVKLKSPIISEIVQLECFRDGKFQYFFNTAEALHLIGHDGNYLPHFPVILKSPATNSVSVADYDHTRDYRFFIAGKDHKVYLFDKKGKPVSGWALPKSEHNVSQPIQFFRIENKDYLVFADKNRVYILDRKGNSVAAVKGNLTYSHNPFFLVPKSGKTRSHLITTDSKGSIIAVGFDGMVKRVTVGKFSPDHIFIAGNSGTDNQQNYLLLDGDSLVTYDTQFKRLFTKKFNHPIASPPQTFIFPDKSRRIGITDNVENKIYLFNSEGTICNGFPLEGKTPFIISFPSSQNGPYNLFTGTADGYLYNYQVK